MTPMEIIALLQLAQVLVPEAAGLITNIQTADNSNSSLKQ